MRRMANRNRRGTRRDRDKESFWRRMVRGQAAGGLSVRGWCRRHRLREATFYWWRKEIARRDAEAPAFVPVRVTSASGARRHDQQTEANASGGRIEIVLSGDRRVRLTGRVDRQALNDVLGVLEEVQDRTTARCAGGSGEARSC